MGIAALLPLSRWYFHDFPAYSRAYFNGTYTAVHHALRGGVACAGVALLLALVFAILRPRMMNPVVVALLLVAGIGVMGSGEYLREFSRYPYVINSYIYANDIRMAQLQEHHHEWCGQNFALGRNERPGLKRLWPATFYD